MSSCTNSWKTGIMRERSPGNKKLQDFLGTAFSLVSLFYNTSDVNQIIPHATVCGGWNKINYKYCWNSLLAQLFWNRSKKIVGELSGTSPLSALQCIAWPVLVLSLLTLKFELSFEKLTLVIISK